MPNEEIKCILCGKVAPQETIKKNIAFYVNWIEYLPGKWMCRECKEAKHDKNLGRYKLQMFFRDSVTY